ncbi:hypothetical protein AHAS_Ahas10G0084600 [Arachis hypogaea]
MEVFMEMGDAISKLPLQGVVVDQGILVILVAPARGTLSLRSRRLLRRNQGVWAVDFRRAEEDDAEATMSQWRGEGVGSATKEPVGEAVERFESLSAVEIRGGLRQRRKKRKRTRKKRREAAVIVN